MATKKMELEMWIGESARSWVGEGVGVGDRIKETGGRCEGGNKEARDSRGHMRETPMCHPSMMRGRLRCNPFEMDGGGTPQ
jgi:hypothetical protein